MPAFPVFLTPAPATRHGPGVSAGTFTRDYGNGNINIGMDDADRDADACVLTRGDQATVNGMVDAFS